MTTTKKQPNKKKATNMISKVVTLFAGPSTLDHRAYWSLNGKAESRAKHGEKLMESFVGGFPPLHSLGCKLMNA